MGKLAITLFPNIKDIASVKKDSILKKKPCIKENPRFDNFCITY